MIMKNCYIKWAFIIIIINYCFLKLTNARFLPQYFIHHFIFGATLSASLR